MAEVCGELVMRCFHARTNAHVLHLQTKSYAEHVALQGFYDGIIPLIDGLAESYQGEYGFIPFKPTPYTPADNGVRLLESLYGWIDENRDEISDDTYIQNQIDEVQALIRSTIYKLKFLK